jgi:prepilin signal peptidase PulO-like enzyme (type II secretory pathway)
MTVLALLLTALLFGGMVLFSFGFAAVLFSALPMDMARLTLRKTFPHFYLFVILTAAAGAAALATRDNVSAALLAAIAVTTVPTRQALMPAINAATDAGATGRFKALHGVSVAITLAHIAVAGVVLARFV